MYLLAGGTGDKEFHNTRANVFSNPEATDRVLMQLYDNGGADGLFDTWANIMANRAALHLVLVLLGTLPVVKAGDDGDWRSREVDVQSWEDGHVFEKAGVN